MRIGVSGDMGSFSEEAGRIYAAKANLQDFSIDYLIDMNGVLAALDAGKIDVGVFPFVNYNSGIVWPAFMAMGKYNFAPIDDLQLNIEQCLMALDGVEEKDITDIYSYTPAFEQCKNFINQNQYRLVDWGDMARAARDLADGKIIASAGIIGAAMAAKAFGLNILKKGIQDMNPNITRFIVVKKN